VAEDDASEGEFECREVYEGEESLYCRLERTRMIHGGNMSRNEQLTGQRAPTDTPLQ
jgi:hypothetical protein